MLGLPDEDNLDEVVKWLARGTRIRVWRSGPADGPTLRAAAEAEVAEAIEHGMLGEDDRTRWIDNIVKLLSGDDSIADPPDADDVGLALERDREVFANWYRPGRQDLVGGKRPPDAIPDRYGNWPGENWRPAVEYALRKVSDRRPSREERDEQGDDEGDRDVEEIGEAGERILVFAGGGAVRGDAMMADEAHGQEFSILDF